MKKTLSLIMALILAFSMVVISTAYAKEGEAPEKRYFYETTENYTRTIKEPIYGKGAACIDIDVTFRYDGTTAEIISIKDNSRAYPDYRLTGSAKKSGTNKVVISYTAVPLGSGSSIPFNITLTAGADGALD